MASSSRPIKRSHEVDAEESCVADESKHYDVFLSHRGPDTKNGFVGFLHKDLKLARLEPFFDIKGGIEKSEDSWECIERAIKKTPISLVIFSENFAGSKWCLRELHLMLETPSVTVLPIFYKVKPLDLRRLEEGPLGAGFKKLQKSGCGEEVLESWRADLRMASTISGWEIDDNTVQADKVEEIVQMVCELSNELLVHNVSSEHDKVGVKQVAEQIIKTLDEKKSIVMLGLWGMGGIGKTTLARELFYLLSRRYASSCHVKDVTEKVSMLDGVEAIQKCILEGLCKGIDVGNIHDVEEGRRLLEGRLSNKSSFLLVLDDVSTEKEMMKYIMTPEMLTGGSLCIVTTRDVGVLKEFDSRLGKGVYAHAMCKLSNEDSCRVFTSYAFGGSCKVEAKFEALVEGMSKACGGVPLVLEVIGSCLKGIDDVDAWEEMRERLEESGDVLMDQKAIYNRLRRSYDTLSPNQQEIFLDIACGLTGKPVDHLKRVWKSLKWSPTINIPVLVRRALISMDYGVFVMHDVLRDMGRSIEMRKKARERARLWMPESLAKWKEEALPKKLQSLVIDDLGKIDMQILDVSHMKELRILLCTTHFKVTSIPANLRWFSSKYLDINESTLPKIPQNNKLVVLNLPYLRACLMSCKQGHKPPCLALGLGHLTALECLHLRGCKMDELPNLQQLTKLEKLDIFVSKIKDVPGLGHLLSLVKIEARRCFELIGLPNIGNLTSLRKLHLPNTIAAIPGLSEVMPALTDLAISGKGLETLGVVCARELQTLKVWGWSERGLGAGINWAKLTRLTIDGSGAKKLDGLLEMNSLEVIQLSNSKFEDVLCLNRLTTLRTIHIFTCGELKQLPDLLDLARLEILDVCRCIKLIEWTLLSTSTLLSGTTLPSLQTLRLQWVGIRNMHEEVGLIFPQFASKEASDLIPFRSRPSFSRLFSGVWERLSIESETFP